MMVSESRWRIDQVVHIYNSTYSLNHLDFHGQRTTPALQPLVYLRSIFFDFPSGCPNPCCTEDCEMIRFPGHGLDSVATDTDPPFTACAHARCAIGSTAMLCFPRMRRLAGLSSGSSGSGGTCSSSVVVIITFQVLHSKEPAVAGLVICSLLLFALI